MLTLINFTRIKVSTGNNPVGKIYFINIKAFAKILKDLSGTNEEKVSVNSFLSLKG